MKKNILKRYLLLTPVVVLLVTLFFLNYAVQYFKDTGFSLVYNTNVESVKRFSRELNELSAQGYTSDVYGDLYTQMIQNYAKTLGEKEAVLTFLIDENGTIQHYTEYNQAYFSAILENEENMPIINRAYASKDNGEINLENNGVEEILYFHHFYSGPKDYTMFMCIDKKILERQLHANGVIIPICVIGLLLMLTMEYTIWLKAFCPCELTKPEPEEEVVLNAD
ncbi:MAG: hypothetical protein LBS21_04230 [Clostridiales bacterium]|nr:hypothetical protein [Clostridiales bacterium]